MFYAVALSIFAVASTGIGGLIVVFLKKTNIKFLSIMLSFSAGIILYISFIEIYPEAEMSLCLTYGKINGKILTSLAFFFGITIMAFINAFIPEIEQTPKTKNNIIGNYRNPYDYNIKSSNGFMYLYISKQNTILILV